MNRVLSALLLFAAHLLSSTAIAADFQFKGRALGSDEEHACGQSTITKHQETLDATGVTGIEFPASGCGVTLDTVAGIKPSGPARLLFWKGRLIRMIVEFERLELEDSAALRVAFIDLYGKPSTKRSSPFRTDIWRSGTHTLQLEWANGFPTSVGAYLTDVNGWADYQRVQARATKAIDEIAKKRRSDDLRR